MKTLQTLHLYLGCIFAPLLLFFAISGLWQTLSKQGINLGSNSQIFTYLSSIHTGKGLKLADPSTLSSPLMRWLIIAMAISLALTIIQGVIMAFQYGHKKTAAYCLLGGIIVPLLLILTVLIR